MPCYFLNVEIRGRLIDDPEGEEFPDIEAARLAVAAGRAGVAPLIGDRIEYFREAIEVANGVVLERGRRISSGERS